MRFLKLSLLFLCGLLLFNGPALALTIGSGAIDVGGEDTLIASADIASSYDAELAWIREVLGSEEYTIDPDKYDVSDSDWTVIDGSTDIFALELMGTPSHYFIKLGVGGTTDLLTHHLYRNLEELMYAVVDIVDWGATAGSINIGRVSHVGEIGGTPVPEPSTVLLLGVGLAGLLGFGRKKFFKK